MAIVLRLSALPSFLSVLWWPPLSSCIVYWWRRTLHNDTQSLQRPCNDFQALSERYTVHSEVLVLVKGTMASDEPRFFSVWQEIACRDTWWMLNSPSTVRWRRRYGVYYFARWLHCRCVNHFVDKRYLIRFQMSAEALSHRTLYKQTYILWPCACLATFWLLGTINSVLALCYVS